MLLNIGVSTPVSWFLMSMLLPYRTEQAHGTTKLFPGNGRRERKRQDAYAARRQNGSSQLVGPRKHAKYGRKPRSSSQRMRTLATTKNCTCCSTERGFLADAPSRLPEHPPGVLPELCQRHAHVALRLHPCYGPQDVVHVPGESLEENARAFVEGDDESRLRDQLGSRLGLGFVGVVVDRPAEWAGGGADVILGWRPLLKKPSCIGLVSGVGGGCLLAQCVR